MSLQKYKLLSLKDKILEKEKTLGELEKENQEKPEFRVIKVGKNKIKLKKNKKDE